MKTLQINESKARPLYKTATPEFKAMLEDTFGKDFFSEKITDIVKSFLDACKVTGDNPHDRKFTDGPIHRIAQEKLEVICKALCEGVKLSYRNGNQKKWCPWMVWDDSISGFRFYAAAYDYSAALAGLGSRLCVDTEPKAKYLGTHPEFVTLINQILINHEI